MKHLVFILILIFFSFKAYSTNQVEDILLYNGDAISLYDSPLEQLDSISQKIENLSNNSALSSACWRGFIAEWIIKDDILYLKNVRECISGKNLNEAIEKILRKKFQNGLIKADWVNGAYWAGKNFVGGVYISVYQTEFKFNVQSGKIQNVETTHYKECAFQSIESIYEFIYSNIIWDHIKSNNLNASLLVYVLSNESGKIISAQIQNSSDQSFNNEIIRLLYMLPCRSVYFNRGQFWNVGEDIDLKINKEDSKKYVR